MVVEPDVLLAGQQRARVEDRADPGDEGSLAPQPTAHPAQLGLPRGDLGRLGRRLAEDEGISPHRRGHRVDGGPEGPGLLDAGTAGRERAAEDPRLLDEVVPRATDPAVGRAAPQPDGPTMTMNSPSATLVLTPWITSSSP